MVNSFLKKKTNFQHYWRRITRKPGRCSQVKGKQGREIPRPVKFRRSITTQVKMKKQSNIQTPVKAH